MTTLAPSGERLAEELSHRWAVEQVQQSLEGAAVVRSDGKSASIKSISECIQSSNAMSFSICTLPFFGLRPTSSTAARFRSRAATASPAFGYVVCSERAICISTTGSRRQLSIDKKEQKRESDEPDAPLLLEGELAVGEVDVFIGGKQSNQANNAADDGFKQALAVEPQPPPGRRLLQIPRDINHPKQPTPIKIAIRVVRAHWLRNGWWGSAGDRRCTRGVCSGRCRNPAKTTPYVVSVWADPVSAAVGTSPGPSAWALTGGRRAIAADAAPAGRVLPLARGRSKCEVVGMQMVRNPLAREVGS
ncbi:hypothetical protein H6G65_19065 [Microcystis elabens FACHB-917]|nr:hypothetical protein [Microcystis elabens FACHB-917]